MEARGKIIAFTDDDAIVDERWVNELSVLFAENPEVMAATGLVVPLEMETEAQVLFELSGGFGRGFQRKWYRSDGKKMPWFYLGAGQYGTGANMAFRRCIFDKIGYFDTALDVGTVTNGGGDLEMFFRILKEGHSLVYEPAAFVWHRHRREYGTLRTQLINNGKGFFSYCVRSMRAYPDERFSFLKLWAWWMDHWILRRLFRSVLKKNNLPNDLIFAEVQGALYSIGLYDKARKSSAKIAEKFAIEIKPDHRKIAPASLNQRNTDSTATAIRVIDLDEPVRGLTDVEDYAKVRLFVKWNNWLIGHVDIYNRHQPLSRSRVIENIVHFQGMRLFKRTQLKNEYSAETSVLNMLQQQYTALYKTKIGSPPLPLNISVSVVVATYDRTDDLRNCLHHLINQDSQRRVEIIVVDNNPGSGETEKVALEFPGIIFINEIKKGLSYARNTGIRHSSADIILTTDDDVTVPPDWIENTVAPFIKNEVMAVTGNVLPIEMETEAQQLFEKYGGLGRGYKRVVANSKWLKSFTWRAAPTWELGACANAAFRATVFQHPKIGFFNELLGAGTPTGCSEDSYLLYKILKANYTVVYEPKSFVWHKHRRSLSAFRKQIYNYSKGHIAHHLLTIFQHNDWRGFFRLLVELPAYNIIRVKNIILGKSKFPFSMIVLEIAGNLMGPVALVQSWWHSRKQNRFSTDPTLKRLR